MIAVLLGGCLPLTARAQFQTGLYHLTDDDKAELAAGCSHLRQTLNVLKEQSLHSGKPEAELLPDVEIFLDAASRNLEQNLFFSKQNVEQAKACLKEGEARADSLKEGKSPWTRQTGTVVLGYRSKVDGSAQPYQVFIPTDYDFDAKKPIRLEVFLHGRGGNLNEPSFLRSGGWVKGNFGGKTPDFLALYPYGRGNNGWRYAGETDVFEALTDCRRRYPADENQIALRGFSMGGHGVFHIGLHTPGIWAVMSPGAGFVDTKQYLKITKPFPDWQDALLHLYDAVDVAANAKNLPLINYVGELDPKLPQYRLMAEALKKENAPFEEIIAPNTEHRYEAKALQSILDKMAPLRRNPNADVHFVTYTLRYPDCKWVEIEGLEQHWNRAEADASLAASNQVIVTTRNIAALRLTPPGLSDGKIHAVMIDGQSVAVPIKTLPSSISLVKHNGAWRMSAPAGLRKKPGLQGPIDDALFGPVLAVAGTGTPWNEDAERWTKQELERFRGSWGRYFRATLPETTDAKLTAEEIRGKTLYLFGDPGSNSVLRRLLPKLPLRWTKDAITLKGKSFTAKDHLPLLIFPNPENPEHYLVINTGMTFSRADQEGSNGQQYPHLPDYAVIRFDADHFTDDRAKDTEFAGFFDEAWR